MKAKYVKIALILENARDTKDRRKKVCKVVGTYRTENGIEYRRGFNFPKGANIQKIKLPEFIYVM